MPTQDQSTDKALAQVEHSDDVLSKVDAFLDRLMDRNNDKPKPQVRKATIELEILAYDDKDAEGIVQSLCENLIKFSDINSAKGKLV